MAGGMQGAGMPQQRMPQQMSQMPPAPAGMPMAQPPQPGAMPPAPMGGAMRQQMSGPAGAYMAKTMKIFPAIQEKNPHYKEQVG